MSKSIKILGTGCPKCKQTTALVEDVVKEAGIDATIHKVEDIMEIMNYDVMTTPAVVIDEVVMIKGRVPSRQEVLDLINTGEASEKNDAGTCCSDENCC